MATDLGLALIPKIQIRYWQYQYNIINVEVDAG